MAEKQDIAMNQFQIVTDVMYIYGEKSDSGQGKIKKSDLHNALFQDRGLAPADDFNNATKIGTYHLNDVTRNAAHNPGVTYGVMVYFKALVYGIQIIFTLLGENNLWKRTVDQDGNWSPWSSVKFT